MIEEIAAHLIAFTALMLFFFLLNMGFSVWVN
jgi:hypothetical protein